MATKKKENAFKKLTKNPIALIIIIVIVIIIIVMVTNSGSNSNSPATQDNAGAPIGGTYLLGSLGGAYAVGGPFVNIPKHPHGQHTKKKHVSGGHSGGSKGHGHTGSHKPPKTGKRGPGSAHYHGHTVG